MKYNESLLGSISVANFEKTLFDGDSNISDSQLVSTKSNLIKEKYPVQQSKKFDESIISEFQDDVIYVGNCELGFCIRAIRNIRKDEIIYTYTGRAISFKETKTRGETECMPLQYDFDKYIDSRIPGRFVNHSCEPNAGIINNFDLIVLEDIPMNAEIRFDYSTTMDENSYTMECKCQKPSCRKIINDFRFLPIEVRDMYLRLGIVSDFIKKQY
jgi:hypothetical protein